MSGLIESTQEVNYPVDSQPPVKDQGWGEWAYLSLFALGKKVGDFAKRVFSYCCFCFNERDQSLAEIRHRLQQLERSRFADPHFERHFRALPSSVQRGLLSHCLRMISEGRNLKEGKEPIELTSQEALHELAHEVLHSQHSHYDRAPVVREYLQMLG